MRQKFFYIVLLDFFHILFKFLPFILYINMVFIIIIETEKWRNIFLFFLFLFALLFCFINIDIKKFELKTLKLLTSITNNNKCYNFYVLFYILLLKEKLFLRLRIFILLLKHSQLSHINQYYQKSNKKSNIKLVFFSLRNQL